MRTAAARMHRPLVLSRQWLARALLWLTVFCGGFVLFEPSPYDVLFCGFLFAVILTGTRWPRLTAIPFGLLSIFCIGGIVAASYHGAGSETVVYVLISAYLALTAIIFAVYVAGGPVDRMDVIARAYVASAVLVALLALGGYFGLLPGGTLAIHGRAAGTFKDPNVFGPFLVFPALLLLQRLISNFARNLLRAGVPLLILIAALLLTFSRAAWANLAISGIVFAALLFVTASTNRFRFRIVAGMLVGVLMAGGVLVALLAIPAVQELFELRAALFQSYDAGATGRFGNQLRSLPELAALPFGYGPYGFGERFLQDPHNVYLNGFAAYGWAGGFAYLGFVLATLLAGFRYMLVRVPWQTYHLAAYAAFLVTALQGAVIDTDHWRHFWLLAGLVWGMSAATQATRRNGSGHPQVPA